MSEWIDPQYADLVVAWRRAQQPEPADGEPESQPTRMFLIPSKG
ncbi:hypothetical protein ACGFX8_33025 [Streptomyces sp. NPDC048362]